jgi:hypothetical protein
VVNTVNSAWENEARYVKGGGRQFEWHGIAGDLDDKTREHLTRELVVWLRSHSGQQVAEVEHKPPSSNSCQDVTAYSRPAVRGDLAFVATAYSCGFDCANGQVIALRKSWIGWLPIARADTWIS